MNVTIQVIKPKRVTLVDGDGLEVRRTLPTLGRSLIGGWCFLDHYGPEDVAEHGGMQVAPHPHTGLQTLSWLFAGEVEHRDSAGNHALIKRGEMNLMTAGRGISHSEMSTHSLATLHGVQLWIALPEAVRNSEPGFEHYVPGVTTKDGVTARVFIGSLLDATSPVRTFSPLVGAQLDLEPGAGIDLELDAAMEHGLLLDQGSLLVDDVMLEPAELAYLATGRGSVRLTSVDGARLMLLGGAPLNEQIVMWWNFIGRTHEEIVAFREQWNAEATGVAGERLFGLPIDDDSTPLLAPTMPALRLKPRG